MINEEHRIDNTPSAPPRANGKAGAASAPSAHPATKSTSTFDRAAFLDPDLSRPVAERQTSKQTIIPIRRPKGFYFRIHPSPDTRLLGAVVLVSKNGKVNILTNAISLQTREALPKGVLKKVDLYLAVDEQGSYFLTYFSASPHENAETWRKSGRMVVDAAERDWISLETNMSEGGYRILRARGKYPKLAAAKPQWELSEEDNPVALFEETINQNSINSDDSPAITKFLEARQ